MIKRLWGGDKAVDKKTLLFALKSREEAKFYIKKQKENKQMASTQRKERIIYTIRLTRYLLDLGFDYIRTTPDPFRKGYSNWIFENSSELDQAIQNYLNKREG